MDIRFRFPESSVFRTFFSCDPSSVMRLQEAGLIAMPADTIDVTVVSPEDPREQRIIDTRLVAGICAASLRMRILIDPKTPFSYSDGHRLYLCGKLMRATSIDDAMPDATHVLPIDAKLTYTSRNFGRLVFDDVQIARRQTAA